MKKVIFYFIFLNFINIVEVFAVNYPPQPTASSQEQCYQYAMKSNSGGISETGSNSSAYIDDWVISDGGYKLDYTNRRIERGPFTSVKIYFTRAKWNTTTQSWDLERNNVFRKSFPDQAQIALDFLSSVGAVYPTSINFNYQGCIVDDPCQQQRDNLISSCGGDNNVDWDTWDESDCTGKCKPCDYGEYLRDRAKCISPALHIWDESTCTGYCEGIGNCTDEDMQNAMQACGARGIAYMNSTDPDCPYQCNDDCQDTFSKAKIACGWYGVIFDWNTCEYSCEKCHIEESNCQQQCADQGGMAHIDCATTARGTVVSTCVCRNSIEPADPGESLGDTPDAPDNLEPDPKGPEDPDNPNGAELVAVDNNIRNLVNQGNIHKDQLHGILNNTRWMGNNNRIIADNTKKTVDAVSGLNNNLQGISGAINNLASGLEGLDLGDASIEELDEITEGTFTPPSHPDPYTSPEHDFSQRTSDFLDNMKTTGIFSLPDQLSSSIPSGGSSVMTIEGGETYGVHAIDFADYSSAIVILRSLFNLAGMIIAIRIVTIKR